ncbi:MAG: signal peptidase I [Oscillospiraceae bacterium]|nr:signal peptidase I [Oscillospiraceae bacterium]
MKNVCNILSTVLLVLLLVLALAFVAPMLFGMKEMAVLSGSMEPNIPVGSIVYVDPGTEVTDLVPGDIVTYKLDSSTFVTHRVVSLDEASQTMITKGDANETADGEIQFSQYYGKVKFHIPYLGFITANIRTPAGIMTVTGVVVLIILLNTLPALLSKEEREEKREQEGKTP